MRIGINARHLQNSRSGIAQYLYYLLLYIRKVDKNNEYTLFLGNDRHISADILDFGCFYDVSRLPTTNQILKIIWQHFYLPSRIKNLRMDVFHEPSFIAPFLKRCPTVVTVHDLAYKFIPNGFNLRNRLYLNRLIKRSLKISDRIIAVSEHTKKDILQNYGIDERKVKVIYEGVDGSFRPINDPQEEIKRLLKTKYGITGNFILTVSLLSPRKNLVSLIKAFSILKKKALIDHQLVIAGRRGWLFKEIFKAAADNEYHRDIVFCGFVPHEDLVKFYNAADVFVYPSLYEGFGLPLLEAM